MPITIGNPRLNLYEKRPYSHGAINRYDLIINLDYLSSETNRSVNLWRGEHPYILPSELDITFDLQINTQENFFAKLADVLIPQVKRSLKEADVEIVRGESCPPEQGQYELYCPKITNAHLVPGLTIAEGTMIHRKWFE